MTVTGIQEVGHTEIRPVLCLVPEAVAVTTGLAVQVVSCYLQIQPDRLSIATELHMYHTVSSLSDSLAFWRAFCSC